MYTHDKNWLFFEWVLQLQIRTQKNDVHYNDLHNFTQCTK